MICKKCGIEHEDNMFYCLNCGEPLKQSATVTSSTPAGNTIKGFANVIFIMEIIIGCIVGLAGIVIATITDNTILFIVSFVVGAIIVALSWIARAFTFGFGVIVSYYERRENE